MDNEKLHAHKISDNIKALRNSVGWNQSKLANQAKISGAALSKIEQGERVPTIVVLRKLANALKVEINEITGEQPIKRSEQEQHENSFFRKFGVLEELKDDDQKLLLEMAQRFKEMTDK